MIIRTLLFVLAAAIASRQPGPARGDEAGARPEAATADASAAAPAADPLAFVAEHHPELADLLEQLRTGDPRAFAEAIAEIDRALEKLARTRERQPERYAQAIEEWKLSSRIRLLLARMALTRDPVAMKELEQLVRARQELRLLPLRAERERLEKRLEKIATTLAEFDDDPQVAVERECRELVERATRVTGSRTGAGAGSAQKEAR